MMMMMMMGVTKGEMIMMGNQEHADDCKLTEEAATQKRWRRWRRASTSSGAALALQVSMAVWSEATGICGRKKCSVCAKFRYTPPFQHKTTTPAAASKAQSSAFQQKKERKKEREKSFAVKFVKVQNFLSTNANAVNWLHCNHWKNGEQRQNKFTLFKKNCWALCPTVKQALFFIHRKEEKQVYRRLNNK